VTELPTQEEFQSCLDESFTVRLESAGTVVLTLAEVTSLAEHNEAPPGVRRQPFSLLFRGEPQLDLPQRIYRLEHERLGSMELFIVPIGPDEQGMRFEAVFG
jgi:hypothetical protein